MGPIRCMRMALAVSAAAFGWCGHAHAWGDQGHRIVAAIAYERLTPEARAMADALLATDAKTDTVTAPDFISRSVWADKVLERPKTSWQRGVAITSSWHFAEVQVRRVRLERACPSVNRAEQPRTWLPEEGGLGRDCIVNKLEQFEADLRDPSLSPAQKVFALKFMIHLMGDLHHPLNVAEDQDVFGQAVVVRPAGSRKPPTMSLHDYWGVELVRQAAGARLTERATAARLLQEADPAQLAQWGQGAIRDWFAETVEVTRRVVYDTAAMRVTGDDKGTRIMDLDPSYERNAIPAVREQLTRAGVRLAAVINEAAARNPFMPGR